MNAVEEMEERAFVFALVDGAMSSIVRPRRLPAEKSGGLSMKKHVLAANSASSDFFSPSTTETFCFLR